MGVNLKRIHVYPVNSARGISPASWHAGRSGFDYDRFWAIVDAAGRLITQRTLPRLALLHIDLSADGWLRLGAPGMSTLRIEPFGIEALATERRETRMAAAGRAPGAATVLAGSVGLALGAGRREDDPPRSSNGGRKWTAWASAMSRLARVMIGRDALEALDAGPEAASWISEFLGHRARLVRMSEGATRCPERRCGAPADRIRFADAFPYLLLAEESLADLNARLVEPLPMSRFRPNLVLSGCAPYAEDTWSRVRIGAVEFRVARPCSCHLEATIDPQTGQRGAEPLRTLRTYRTREGGVMFGQNLIPCGEGVLRVGDPVEVLA